MVTVAEKTEEAVAVRAWLWFVAEAAAGCGAAPLPAVVAVPGGNDFICEP